MIIASKFRSLIKNSMKFTSDQMSLLLSYLSVIGLWTTVPTVSFYVTRDKHFKVSFIIMISLVTVVMSAYLLQWRVLFPEPPELLKDVEPNKKIV